MGRQVLRSNTVSHPIGHHLRGQCEANKQLTSMIALGVPEGVAGTGDPFGGGVQSCIPNSAVVNEPLKGNIQVCALYAFIFSTPRPPITLVLLPCT